METKKKNYTTPDIKIKHVEVESSICGGSVEFGDKEKPEKEQVVISSQSVVGGGDNDPNNFSGQTWGSSTTE
ncbi:MAG: hypothetical protein K2O88_09880 [Paramuribaculum sp.]|nr:hypothetical protein [Paramuribaculum sp.]